MLCCVVLCCVVLYCIVLYCVVLFVICYYVPIILCYRPRSRGRRGRGGWPPAGRTPAGTLEGTTANLRTHIMDFRGFDSNVILILRGGIPGPLGDFLESLSQAILVGIILVGRWDPLGFPQRYEYSPFNLLFTFPSEEELLQVSTMRTCTLGACSPLGAVW